MKRIAIIGGGISGLTAAYKLEGQRASGVEYVLFEAGSSFGGVIRTEHQAGCVIEAGPDSFLSEKPWAADLCRELGLGEQLIGSNDSARRTYILLKGRLVPLPDGLMFMIPTKLLASFFSPLFSARTKFRMIAEWFSRPRRSQQETVADFVRRHYGSEMVERVADPLLAGVYGGPADELSLQAVMPRFAEMEARQGSLGRAIISARKNRRAGQARPLFTSLKNGMQQMVEALLTKIPEASRCANTRIREVRPESRRWLVVTENGRTLEFDAVIVATPAYAAGEILRSTTPSLATELQAIRYSPSVTVALIYDQRVRATVPAGFGFLVPRSEKRRVIAVTFVHNKFPHRAPPDRALIRCFLGGSRDEDIVSESDEVIRNVVSQELRETLGITAPPLFTQLFRWKKAMALYGLGHTDRIARIQQITAALPGLALAGNAYGGIGVPDCVRSGSEAAAKVLEHLAVAVNAVAS